MYIPRKIEERLKKALKQFPVCLVVGPRQAGKSTLLNHFLKDYQYVTFDDPIVRQLATEDPELFLSHYPPPIILDEIQYVPTLFPYIKMRVDANRHKYGQFVLTGSQAFQVMEGVSESLAGRIALFNLYPFSWREIPNFEKTKYEEKYLGKQIIKGFYPEFLVTPDLDLEIWFRSYISTYIERDIRNIKNITDLSRFQTFITLLAGRAGSLLNLSEISKECGISQPTAKNWITLLESTFIIYLLKPFHNNFSKRLVKSPKLYFYDTGLLCYLLGITSYSQFFKSPMRGHLFENMLIIDVIKRLSYQSKGGRCFFYRTASGIEVDLIIQQEQKINAYEIKFAKTIHPKMAASLNLFRNEHSVDEATVLSLNPKTIPLREGIVSKHWSVIT